MNPFLLTLLTIFPCLTIGVMGFVGVLRYLFCNRIVSINNVEIQKQVIIS